MSRLRIPFAATVAVASIAAGALLGTVTAQTPGRADARYRIYAAALAAVEAEYVEPLDSLCSEPSVCGPEALVYESIDGMLRTLDPHSSFFSPKQFAQMRERQEGRYFGIGISIVSVQGDVTVTSLFEGSPAYRAGIRRGDIIAKVGEEEGGPPDSIALSHPANWGDYKLDLLRQAVRHADIRVEVEGRRVAALDRLAAARELRADHDLVVVDCTSYFNDTTLAILDAADVILTMLSLEITSIKNMRLFLEVAEQLGYEKGKVRLVLNRADSALGIRVADVEHSIGRKVDETVVSDGRSVVYALNRGVPFFLSNREAQVSQDILRLARSVVGGQAQPDTVDAGKSTQKKSLFAWR